MLRARFAVALFAFVQVLLGQNRPSLTEMLNFETTHTGKEPAGWFATPHGTVSVDGTVVHGGKWSVRIARTSSSTERFSTITCVLPFNAAGKEVVLSGFIRRENVQGAVALWIRQDGDQPNLAFDTLRHQRLNGTADWQEYSVRLPIHKDAKRLVFGFLLSGTGTAWVDDMRLELDGVPFEKSAKIERVKTVLDTDTEFAAGSKIALATLSPVQIENLATLGKVWGFLKYHHPAITSGKRNWDFDLFRMMPAVLAAPDRAAANAAMAKFVKALGAMKPCAPCAKLEPAELHFGPDIAWIHDTAKLGAELSALLVEAHKNRPADGKQFYIVPASNVSNAQFNNESGYESVTLPDAGYQLLALYRFHAIIRYWFPYRDITKEDWDAVLAEFIPKLALAKTAGDYKLQLIALIAKAHDTHANLWSGVNERPPKGNCRVPVSVRFVDERAVVARYIGEANESTTSLKPGDIIEAVDGVATPQLLERWKPYYAASNWPTALRDMARGFTNGECGDVKLRVRRGAEAIDIAAKRISAVPASGQGIWTHDRAGDTVQRLSKDVTYLKMSTVKLEEVERYIDTATGAKGLIIDLRNYPSAFLVFALGGHLVEKDTPFARFTVADLSNPGAFHFGKTLELKPLQPRFKGKVVILLDEVTQSSAEYTSMAFRSSPNAVVIGSTTAGADGNVSPFALPGGQRSMVSGIGVFYPDQRPTQRVGIIPDRVVKPTVEGLRAGRDEVLEAALREILGAGVPDAEIEKMAGPNGSESGWRLTPSLK